MHPPMKGEGETKGGGACVGGVGAAKENMGSGGQSTTGLRTAISLALWSEASQILQPGLVVLDYGDPRQASLTALPAPRQASL